MDLTRSKIIRNKILHHISQNQESGSRLPAVRDLARSLSVSPTTVQKAINMLREDGMVESRGRNGVFVLPQSVKTQKSKVIGIVSPAGAGYLKSAWPASVLKPLRKALSSEGYGVETYPLFDWVEKDVLAHIGERKLAGLVLFEMHSDLLVSAYRGLRVPMVSADYDLTHLGIPSVVFDNTFGTMQATRYLIDQGHKYIVFIGIHDVPERMNLLSQASLAGHSPDQIYPDAILKERFLGYRLAMQQAGLNPVGEYLESFNSREQGKFQTLLARKPGPTAVVCYSSQVAEHFYSAVKRLGYSVPDDISIFGFGGPTTYEENKTFSHLSMDDSAMGKGAARLLVKELRRDVSRERGTAGRTSKLVIIPTQLSIHDSTGALAESVVR